MATTKPFFSSANTSSSSSITPAVTALVFPQRKRQFPTVCNASISDSLVLTKRGFSVCLTTTLFFSLATTSSKATILEADEDDELMEKVKTDRKKRIERQGVINSANKEKGYLQEAVFKLSKVGEAIDAENLSEASLVLGDTTETDWVKRANIAFTKLSFGPEEKAQVDAFNLSLASLISSVTQKDTKSSKTSFVSCATAFENWSTLSGLVTQLKGL